MPRKKEFSEETKLELLQRSINVEDIRDILPSGIHRAHILQIAQWGLNNEIINQLDFDSIITKIEKPKVFPTDSEKRLEALLSIANTEPKQILGLLLKDEPLTIDKLTCLFLFFTDNVLKNINQNIEGYLTKSLDSIGFIAFPRVEELKIGYQRTVSGKIYCQPFLSFALDMANQINLSMYQVLGQTNSPGGSEAPYNRFRILEYLLQLKKQGRVARIIDIVKLLNLNEQGVRSHLEKLKEINFIEYDSISSEKKGQINYTWDNNKKPDNVPIYRGMKSITLNVAIYLSEYKKGSYIEIAQYLSKKEEFSNWSIKSLFVTISSILSFLSKNGFVISYHKKEEKSHVWLKDDYIGFCEEFTFKCRDALQDGKELKAMEELYRKYTENYDIFRDTGRKVMERYVQISPHINEISKEDAQRKIINYLTEKGEARPSVMSKDLEFSTGSYLSDLVKASKLNKRKEGKRSLYSINPNFVQ